MTQYRVYMSSNASLAITVEVDDDGMDVEEAREAAMAEAYQEAPGQVCAQCSGWGRHWDLDLGEWEVDDAPDAVAKQE